MSLFGDSKAEMGNRVNTQLIMGIAMKLGITPEEIVDFTTDEEKQLKFLTEVQAALDLKKRRMVVKAKLDNRN